MWTLLIPLGDPNSPPIDDLATMSFNPLLNQIILFAGLQNNTTVLNDTWAFDGNAIFCENSESIH